jgi:hypothetical protein
MHGKSLYSDLWYLSIRQPSHCSDAVYHTVIVRMTLLLYVSDDQIARAAYSRTAGAAEVAEGSSLKVGVGVSVTLAAALVSLAATELVAVSLPAQPSEGSAIS